MVDTGVIDKAIASHESWKLRLKAAIMGGDPELPVHNPIGSAQADDKCVFGRWLYGPELSESDKQTEDYRAVLELHAKFHVEAGKLARCALSNQEEEPDKWMRVWAEYTRASLALANALSNWRKRLE